LVYWFIGLLAGFFIRLLPDLRIAHWLIKVLLQINSLLMRKLVMDELNRKSVDEFRGAEKIPVIAVLENIRSAYNVGSVFRTADAFLIEAVFITGYTAKPPHKEITKTALGAQDSVDWKYFDTTKLAIEQLKRDQYRVFAVEQVADSISLEKLSRLDIDKIAFIFGNEVSGVDNETLVLCDGCVEIPQFGMKHSLNISVATGIVLWEAVKTKSFQKD
jgi:23S rRNA (guanosine2251-2'-O)-methyltransferase